MKKMLEKIKEVYYILKLTEKLKDYISCCILCILAERKRGKKEGMLMSISKGEVSLTTYHFGPITAT